MQEEIFGPILPIITYQNLDEAIKFINSGDKPLALYYFGDKNTKACKRLNHETSSGAFATNDALMQVLNPYLPFGGVGYSGYGRYHGYEGFKQCSNSKAVFLKAPLKMYPYNKLLPPFTPEKQQMIRKLIKFTAYGDKKFGKHLITTIFIIWLL